MARAKKSAATHAAIESLQRLSDLFRERRRQLARAVDLSEPQWRLLEEVAGDAFMPSMFARRQDTAPAAVSRTLRQLQDRGLVAASISETDARQRVYELTEAGRETLGRLRRSRERAIEAVWGSFSERELAGFARFATTLADSLEAYREREQQRGRR